MTSVFGKLQALVSNVVSTPAQQPSPHKHQQTLSSSPTPDGTPAASPHQPVKLSETTSTMTVVTESAGLSGDTLRVSTHGRPRRQTDASMTSVASAGTSTGAGADTNTSTVRQQDIDKLLPYRMPDLERISRLHPVSKMLQQDSWDCGLACVCMILRSFGQATCSISQLARQAKTDSVWTIDLVYLLHQNLNADFTYYTKCAGINPEYASHAFYQEGLDEDEVRVQKLFNQAQADQAIRIVEIVIPLIDLKRFLVHRQYVAILLVDKAVLKCVSCEMARQASAAAAKRLTAHGRSRSVNIFRSNTSASESTVSGAKPAAGERTGMLSWFSRKRQMKAGYLGHYILLIAYIPSLDMFLFRDPGIPEEFCMASATMINTARNRPGTDADCVILKL